MSDGHHAPIDYHVALVSDPWRLAAWLAAIQAVVRPGHTVLDVGTGTGVLAVLAARAGARVIAVESADVARIAQETAARSGVGDRITVVHADLADVPAEPVDWILADFIGRALPDATMLRALRLAAAWSTPQTRWLPGAVTLQAGLVADVPLPALDRLAAPVVGVDLSAALGAAQASTWAVQLPYRALLTPGQALGTVIASAPVDHVRSTLDATAPRAALLRGIAVWFTSDFAPGVALHTAPGRHTFWGQTLLPTADVYLQTGDTVKADIQARSLEGGVGFAWTVQVHRQGQIVHQHAGASPAAGPPPVPTQAPPSPDKAAASDLHRRALGALEHDPATAASLLEQARQRGLDDPAHLGRAWLRAGHPDIALPALLQAQRRSPTEPVLHDLVLAAAHRGDQGAAAELLDAYEARFGAHPSARKA